MVLLTKPNARMKTPILTIGLGVYNNSNFLAGALDGLLSQTFHDFDLVISDNASTDDSPEIIRQYAEKDHRIRLFRQTENIGLIKNFNFLTKHGQGKYFMWAACDDRWSPEYVETIIAGMEKDPSIIFGFTPYQFIDEESNLIGFIQHIDFSGKHAFGRLYKFFTHYDDRPVYGIYRYSEIKGQEFPVWWGRNASTPYNSAYAFLTYVLAKGNYRKFGEEPLFNFCLKTTNHFQPFKEKKLVFRYIFFLIIRKINVAYIQFINIWRGSGSLFLALIFIPILLIRATLDIIFMTRNSILKRLPKNRPFTD